MVERILPFLLFLFAQGAWAQASLYEVREFYNGGRGLAMGGAAIATVNDETALLVNPAALGKLRDTFGTIIDPEIAGGGSLANIYYNKAFSSPLDLQAVKESLDFSRGMHFHWQGSLFPSFVVRNFGVGIFTTKQINAKMNTQGNLYSVQYRDDLAMIMGFNFRFLDGRIKLGANARLISRIEVDKDLDPNASLALANTASEGAAIATDLGLILTAPWAWLPTVSAVLRDVGGTSFSAGSGLRLSTTQRPNSVPQDLDVGIAVFPIHSNSARSSLTIEMQKLKESSSVSDKNRYLHIGYELNYADLFFLRAGMNQRYWTAGLEIASERTQIQLSTYGEDVGPVGSPVEDRRLLLKWAFRF